MAASPLHIFRSGAHLVGVSGIADGRRIVTYVGGGNLLQKTYPKLSVQDDSRLSFFCQRRKDGFLKWKSCCLSWAEKQGLIDSNPIARLEVPSGERKEIVIRHDEFQEVLASVHDEGFLLPLLLDQSHFPEIQPWS